MSFKSSDVLKNTRDVKAEKIRDILQRNIRLEITIIN